MIMVDTSVWIDYLNGLDNLHTVKLDEALAQGTVAIGDVIFWRFYKALERMMNSGKPRYTLQRWTGMKCSDTG